MFLSNATSRKKSAPPSHVKCCLQSRENRTFFGLLAIVIITVICSPALALFSPSSSNGAGQFDQGIPVYWPYHAMLMATGLILIVAGFIIARFYKTGNWFKTHMSLEVIGGVFIIAGLFIGIYMVALSGLVHLRNIHEVSGAIIGILLIITITLGYCVKRVRDSKNAMKVSHRWLGRISIVLLVINIGFGLWFLSIILHR